MGIANHLFVVYVLYMIIYDKTAKTLSLKLQHKIKTAHATDTLGYLTYVHKFFPHIQNLSK